MGGEISLNSRNGSRQKVVVVFETCLILREVEQASFNRELF